MDFNHKRPLSDFEKEINILRSNGYKPIAVTQMNFEDTFVFETEEEAAKAFIQFESKPKSKVKISGWWYGRKSFEKAVKKYDKDTDYKVLVYWLK